MTLPKEFVEAHLRNLSCTAEFEAIFKRPLAPYLEEITGFDLIAFDKDMNVPGGMSLEQWLPQEYGESALELIHRLLSSWEG